MRALTPQEVITVLSAQYATAIVERDTAIAQLQEHHAKVEALSKKIESLEHPAPLAPAELPTQ